ncbi:MAG: 50S ribosomal protein L29 [Candidatus Hydrogenedentes bacterium ADurb.Bin101]|nr:MAG: 50S ribosomal protein L29 [Candidatus Hydrogenedentes bacterium ADurb.Bin101]HOC69103.1 50S ribosomal protein L29 [Candidatus Hydrogenedentota bacterium]
MRAKELRDKTADALMTLIEERQDDIVNFRLQQATGIVDNCRRAREARRDIARIKTIMKEREIAAAKGTNK